jgi:hypothetical protein
MNFVLKSLHQKSLLLKSVGNFFLPASLISFTLVLGFGCTHSNDVANPNEEYSLKEDRSKFDELRKDIPQEKRQENDEEAFILELTGQVKRHPNEIRESFNKVVRQKRKAFQDNQRKKRDEYRSADNRKQEEFLRKQKELREKFTKKKSSSSERGEFFQEQDKDRRQFFTEKDEKRRAFDSDLLDKSREFEASIRDRTNSFYQAHKDYSKRFEESQKEAKKKALEAAKGRPAIAPAGEGPDQDLLKQFDEIPATAPTRLGSDPNEN